MNSEPLSWHYSILAELKRPAFHYRAVPRMSCFPPLPPSRQTQLPGCPRPIYLLSLIATGLLLLGCTPPPAVSSSQMEANLGQTLPISAQVKVADQIIQLEVAQTPEQQATGLMYRDSLADDRGMLFSFNPARRVSFWMKNVRINLDMVFLRNGQVKDVANNVPPCTTEPCPTYGPNTAIDQVIELRGGRAAELGIQVGDRLKVQSQ